MNGLIKYPVAESTGVATEGIDSIIARNKVETAYNIGTIGPTPFHQTEEGQKKMYDIAEGFVFPGSGLGASIRGGRLIEGMAKSSVWKRDMMDWLSRNIGKAGIKSKPSGKMSLDEASKKLKNYFSDFEKGMKERFLKPIGKNDPKSIKAKLGQAEESMEYFKKTGKGLDDIIYKNKLSIARLKNKQVLEKHGISDPDYERFVHPANYLLDQARKLTRN